jgi:peptidoglycan pentaglycine glycine transferase (the first glycine)
MYTTLDTINPADWDAFVCQHPRAHFLQLSGWGVLKSEYGWQQQRVAIANTDGIIVAGAQILYRRALYGLVKLAYIPFGPLLDWQEPALVEAFMKALHTTLRRARTSFLKIEPGYDVPLDVLRQHGFRESLQTVQPPRTLVIDVAGSTEDDSPRDEDAIMREMNQGTRRNIRKSAKHDVEIRRGTTHADVDSFNQLLGITSDRQEFGVHVPGYYHRIFDLFIERNAPLHADLLLASYTDPETQERTDLAGVIVFALREQSWYQYGASSTTERQRMAMFGAQWAAIQWAREHGASVYDMVGVPDEDTETLEAQFKSRNDGLWGVYRFKRGWGGRVVRTVGAWDWVYNPLIYNLYRAYIGWRRGRTTDDSEHE